MRKIVSGLMSVFLLIGTFTLAFNVGLVRAQASQTIYINSDGSVMPSSAPISTVDNVTYTFTGNISYPAYNGIVVERNNIMIDGNGYVVQGDQGGNGVSLTDMSNVTIENANIENFSEGIYLADSNNNVISSDNATTNFDGLYLNSSSNNIVSSNNVTANYEDIYLFGSTDNTLNGNNATANVYGIWLDSSSNNVVSGNTASANSGDGILLDSSSNNTITANNASANTNGIDLESSSNNTVSGNNATANSYGIILISSNNNTVSDNNATANYWYGIWLEGASNNNIVSGNNVTASFWNGIEIDFSSGNVLSGNVLDDNGYNFGVSGVALDDFMNSIDTSNLVNGKPIYYITSESNLMINPENYPNIGYLAVVNCTNMTVQGLTLTSNTEGNEQGILLASTNNSKITNNNATNNEEGIELVSSSNNTVSSNNATGNRDDGIDLEGFSNNNTVSGNNASANSDDGIDIYSSSNTVSGNNASANYEDGIELDYSSNSTVSGNNASANSGDGIFLWGCSNNTVSGNNVTANGVGIILQSSSNNTIYHNNFIGNNVQASLDLRPLSGWNAWDDGYPSGGNFWSDYKGTDLYGGPYQNVTGSDGIGDTQYVIGANNTDDYPLMGMFSDFNVAVGVDVQVVSNSTISDFQFNGTAILFNVSGVNGTTGFCNVCVPTGLFNGSLIVLVNGTQVQYSTLPSSNGTQTYLYFTYGHSTEQVTIVPEFPDSFVLAVFMLATLLAIAVHKKKRVRR